MKAVARFVITFTLTLLIVGCGITDLSEAEYISQAQTSIDKGDLAGASIQLKNALRQNPDSTQARWLLGKVYLTLGNGPSAEKELLRAQELGVIPASVLPPLAEALLLQQKFDDVLKIATGNKLPATARAEIIVAQGTALLLQGKTVEAESKFNQALALQTDSLTALTGIARVHLSRGELSRARERLAAVLEISNTYAPAWNVLGDVERADKHLEKADQAYTQAIDNQVDSANYRLKRAFVRILKKDYVGAQADIDLLKQRTPRHAEVNYAQAQLYYEQQRYAEALEALEITLNSSPQHAGALFYLGATHYALGNWEQAESYVSSFVSSFPSYHPAVKLLAGLKLKKGRYGEAEALLRPVLLGASEDIVAIDLMANALLKQGKTKEAISLLQKATVLQPGSAGAHLRLATGLMVQGQGEASVKQLKQALELDPDLQQADITLVQASLLQGDYDKAFEAAQAYQARNPDAATPYDMIALVALARKQPDEAERAFRKAISISPGDVYANHSLAAMAIQRGKLDEARAYYEAVLTTHEDHLTTLIQLSALDARENREDAMLERLEQALSKHPDAAKPRILLGRYYLKKGKPEKVSAILGDLSGRQSDNPIVLTLEGKAQLALKQGRNARATLERLVAITPKSAVARFLLAQAFGQLGELKRMEVQLYKALELDPNYHSARLELTQLQLSEGRIDQADENLLILKEKMPNNLGLTVLDARIAQVKGKQPQALDHLETVFEKKANARTLFALTNQLWSMGERDRAVDLLKQWISSHPAEVSPRLVLANAYITIERIEPALAEYRKVLELSQNNVVALNDLAWHLKDTDPEAALQYAEKAVKLAPAPGTLDTLAVVLLKNGQSERALTAIEQAERGSDADRTILFHKSMALEANGRTSEAEALLVSLLQDKKPFLTRKEAEQMLSRLQKN